MKNFKQMFFKACLVLLVLMPSTAVMGAHAGESAQSLVQVNGQYVSIHAINAPLEILLTHIARQSGIEIYYQGRAGGNVTMDMHRASLETGIKRVISGHNHAFTYGYDDHDDIRIKQLFVYSRTGRGSMHRMATSDTTPTAQQAVSPADNGIVIHAKTPNENDPLVSMQAIDPLMRLNQAHALYLPEGFDRAGLDHGAPLGALPLHFEEEPFKAIP